MIFVDTSVWVAALSRREKLEARELLILLDSDQAAISIPVFLEVLAGAPKADRARLRSSLMAVPLYYPTDQTWRRAESWIERAGDSGEHFGFADLLVGAIAAENDALFWSLDTDFKRMARLKFLRLFEPE